MVLLIMTTAIVAAVQEYNTIVSPEKDTSSPSEPSLADPALGKPISHSQILDIQKRLKLSSTSNISLSLDDLLRGAHIYTPPPKPKAEPTQEYKDLMARLRREEEARTYNAMLAASGTPSNPFSLTSKGTPLSSGADTFAATEDDEITFSDINRQLALIVNVLISIIACGVSIWLVASHISAPKRLALAMSGALIVAVAEVAIYAGYLRRLTEAKVREKGKKERKTITKTWTIGGSLAEKDAERVGSGRAKGDEVVRFRAGKRR